jgi:succinate dehydrogenase / fumarate reductase flavoprotein subunit
VFGKSAGETAVNDLKRQRQGAQAAAAGPIDRTLARVNRLEHQKDGADVHQTRLAMQRTMQKHAACSASRTC